MTQLATKLMIPTVTGTPYAGGFYAGRILIDDHLFSLIFSTSSRISPLTQS